MQLFSLHKTKLGLIGLRGLSILAKFVFTTLYFRYSEAAFGEYSLVATTILLLVFLMGMDFYSYANREILTPDSNPQKIIFNQFSLYLILYVLLFPVVYFIFKWANFNPDYQYLFYAVLITEHLNFEFYRLLFVFKKPLAANINLFFRNGFWVLLAAVLIYKNNSITMQTVLQLWLLGNVLALLFSLALSWSKRHKIALQNFVWDKQWILKGLYISIPYILGSLAYKTIEFSDRYMIDYFLDRKAVGVYAFFSNIANVLNIVVFTVVISVLYPSLVEKVMERNKPAFEKVYRKFTKEVWIYSLGFGLLLLIILPILLKLIDKEVYLQQFYVFVLLLAGNIILNISFVYHFVIYAYKKDWKIFKATLWAAVANVILNLLLIPYWGIAGAAVATFISFLTIIVYKQKEAKKLVKDWR